MLGRDWIFRRRLSERLLYFFCSGVVGIYRYNVFPNYQCIMLQYIHVFCYIILNLNWKNLNDAPVNFWSRSSSLVPRNVISLCLIDKWCMTRNVGVVKTKQKKSCRFHAVFCLAQSKKRTSQAQTIAIISALCESHFILPREREREKKEENCVLNGFPTVLYVSLFFHCTWKNIRECSISFSKDVDLQRDFFLALSSSSFDRASPIL